MRSAPLCTVHLVWGCYRVTRCVSIREVSQLVPGLCCLQEEDHRAALEEALGIELGKDEEEEEEDSNQSEFTTCHPSAL